MGITLFCEIVTFYDRDYARRVYSMTKVYLRNHDQSLGNHGYVRKMVKSSVNQRKISSQCYAMLYFTNGCRGALEIELLNNNAMVTITTLKNQDTL